MSQLVFLLRLILQMEFYTVVDEWLGGYSSLAIVWIAHTLAHVALCSPSACLVQTPSSLVLKWHVGRITRSVFSSYSYWFRNYVEHWGMCLMGIDFMELYWCRIRNMVDFIGFANLPCVR